MVSIHGLVKTTLLDYPGRVAATIFLGSCNFRCPFCHNGSLVLTPEKQPNIAEAEIFDFLEKRKGILQGVCITGGEPTLDKDLPPFINCIKELGYPVKLDTNGCFPQVIKRLIEKHLIDYVAMDIKSSPKRYSQCTGIVNVDLDAVMESVGYIMQSGIDYEFRTTVVKELHKEQDFHEIGNVIMGAERYFLQAYRDSEDVICPGLHPPEMEAMEKYKAIMLKYVKEAIIRGMDS